MHAPWNPDMARAWLDKAGRLQPSAYSCGLVGFIALHTLLGCQHQQGRHVTPRVVTCQAPTYYGMMAAVFQLHSD